MILIATRAEVCVSTASTTLPNVPWPSKRTVRSWSNHVRQGNEENMKPTAPVDHVIGDDNIVAFFVVTGRGSLGCLGDG